MTSKWTTGCPILYSLPPTAPRWLVPYSVQGAAIRCVTRKITSTEVRVERFGRRRNPFGYLREGGQVVGGACRISLCQILTHARAREDRWRSPTFASKQLERRPSILPWTLEAGEAKALVVAKLDRLSRSILDLAALMATAQKQSWALVALDCAVDTSTPAGEATAHVLAGDLRAVRAAADRPPHEESARGQEGSWCQARPSAECPPVSG